MYTLSEIVTQVAERIGKTDATFKSKIENWLNGRYHQILKAAKWVDTIRSDTVAATADQEYLILPQDCGQLLAVEDRTNDRTLSPITAEMASRMYVDSVDVSGTPESYWIQETTVLNQPSSAATIAVVSSSAGDTSQKVRVHGRTASGQTQASATLNGTTSANTLTSCTHVDQVSKDAVTVGFVTFSDGTNTIAVIYPRERTARYKKLYLVKKANSALTYNIRYKRRLPRLEFDEDVPLFDCWNALVMGGYADALYQQRQFQKAMIIEQKFNGLVEDLIFEQVSQGENVERTIPHVQQNAIDSPLTFSG